MKRVPAVTFAVLTAIVALGGARQANAQSAYGYSSISITASGVYSTSMTDLDYVAQAYYSVETDGYLWAGSSIGASGSVYSNGAYEDLYVPTTINQSYYIQTNHWVIPIAGGSVPNFSCVSPAWYAGSFGVSACGYTTSPTSVYIGTSYASGNTYGSPPSIGSVDQTTYGTAQVGSSGYIILYGSNLATPFGTTSVSMGDYISSSITYAGQTQVNVYYTIPAYASPGYQSLVLSTPYGSTDANFYVYPPPTPTISSISPNPVSAGSYVTIYGTNFGASQGSSTVTFNGQAASINSWSATSIIALVPAAATNGYIYITVGGITGGGFAFQVAPPPPPVITSLAPNSGAAGTVVTITGSNFGAITGTVTFNGTAAAVSNWGPASITVTVPVGATTGGVVVTTASGPSNPVNFTITALITGLSLPAGPVQVGFVINGTNFGANQGGSTASLAGRALTIVNWSNTVITAQVPAGAGTGPVTLTVNGFQSNGNPTFTVRAPFGCGP